MRFLALDEVAFSEDPRGNPEHNARKRTMFLFIYLFIDLFCLYLSTDSVEKCKYIVHKCITNLLWYHLFKYRRAQHFIYCDLFKYDIICIHNLFILLEVYE